MRLSRFAVLFGAFLAGAPVALLGCTGDDNSLPLPPDAGADAKAHDGGGSDATTEKADADDDGSKEPDSSADSTSPEADGSHDSTLDASDGAVLDAAADVEFVQETGADAASDGAPDGS